jgi:hypothetical protein
MQKINRASFLEILSHISYKYVGLCLLLIINVLFSNNYIYYAFVLYFYAISAIFVVNNYNLQYKTIKRYTVNQMSQMIGMETQSHKTIMFLSLTHLLFSFLLIFLTI